MAAPTDLRQTPAGPMTPLLVKALSWGVPAVALLMLALTIAPAEVWTPPVNDAVYRGFDPNLIYTNNGSGGAVKVSPTSIEITTAAGSQPSANLATTLMPDISASMDVAVLENNGAAAPLRIGAWSPWSESGQFIVFGPGPENLITAEVASGGGFGPALAGGTVLQRTALGHYRLGSRYTVAIAVDRSRRSISTSVSGADGVNGHVLMTPKQSPALFGGVQISLNAAALGGAGTSRAVIANYVLTLPHQRWWAAKIADPRAKALQVALSVGGLLLLFLTIAMRLRNGVVPDFAAMARSMSHTLGLRLRMSGILLWILAAVGLYLVGNALLFRLGGHPFDMAYEKLYAYVAPTYGPSELYNLLNTQSLARIWDGDPLVETSFPYGAVMAFLFTAIGWFDRLVFGAAAFRPDSIAIEYTIKAVNVLFGLANAAIIYAILRQIGVSVRWSLIPAALFLFNPAVWFSMSVWGQTHVISLFFVLLAVLLAERRMALWAWLALTAAVLTRPQMIVFGVLLGIVFLRRFSWRENLRALAWTTMLTFLALLPLTLLTSPSLPIDVMLNNFRIQEAGGNASALSPVSQGGYTIWPLLTYLAHGASGLERSFAPSSDVLVGTLTYQRAAQILTVGAILLVSAALLFRRRASLESGGYLPLVTLGVMLFLMLVTGVVATHFLLALPLLLLCRRWMNNIAFAYVIAIWTVATFVPMYGEMGAFLTSQDYPLLAPANNRVTKLVIDLYSWDRFITVAVVANICAVIWLALTALRHRGTPSELHVTNEASQPVR